MNNKKPVFSEKIRNPFSWRKRVSIEKGVNIMNLIRALLKIDENGQIMIPQNVVRALGLEAGQHIELRLLPQNKIQLTTQEKLSSKSIARNPFSLRKRVS